MQGLRKAGLMAAMTVVGLNIWTGNPLLALWVGSRVQGETTQLKMPVVAIVAVMMGAVGFGLARLLAVLGGAYDRLTGQTAVAHRHVPWLRSMRDERVQHERERVGLTGMEIVIVAVVVLAVAAFEIWFFFYSSSPIDQRTGRE